MRTTLFPERTYNYVPNVRFLAVPTYPNNTFHINVRKLRIFATVRVYLRLSSSTSGKLPTITNIRCSQKYVFVGTKLPLRNVRTSLVINVVKFNLPVVKGAILLRGLLIHDQYSDDSGIQIPTAQHIPCGILLFF